MEYFEEEFDQAVTNIDITPSEVPPSLQWRSLGGPVQRRPVVRWEIGTLEMEVRAIPFNRATNKALLTHCHQSMTSRR